MNLWRLYFEICDFLVGLVPNQAWREKIRRNKLYDYRKKFNALKTSLPRGDFKRVRVIKGGWNIGFIIDNKYVCKIRKFCNKDVPTDKIMREKRITDAFAPIVPVRIPRIEIIKSNGYIFYKYEFIPGKNLNRMPLRTIEKNGWKWGKQLAEFIDAMHNADPAELADLKTSDGDGWNHHDICNNIIVDTKTMNIVGLIDWEYSGWGPLKTEFRNCTAFSKKMQESGIGVAIQLEYHVLQEKKKQRNKKIKST